MKTQPCFHEKRTTRSHSRNSASSAVAGLNLPRTFLFLELFVNRAVTDRSGK